MPSRRCRLFHYLLYSLLLVSVGCIAGLPRALQASQTPREGELRVCAPQAYDPSHCQFATLKAALADAHPGQTIVLAPGTYREGVKISVPGIRISGEPGAHFTEQVYNGKGIFTVTAEDVTIEGIEFSDAHARDGNGAAIRLETSRATIRNNLFRNNQMHILGGTAGGDGQIVIEDNRMVGTQPSSNYNHSVYISKKVEGALIFRRNSVIGTRGQGHGLKTGAGSNLIEDNVIAQLDGDGSLCIDIIIGGHSEIRNNLCQSGPNRDNETLLGIALGQNRDHYPKNLSDHTLIEGNTFILDGGRGGGGCLLLSGSSGEVEIIGNILVGLKGACRGLLDPLGARIDPIVGFIGLPLRGLRANNRIYTDRQAAGLPAYPALPKP